MTVKMLIQYWVLKHKINRLKKRISLLEKRYVSAI
ncbi:hypothetical protein UFOVP660_25 [uncultured Caudovirales phage]|uniref:Uncharacterized protein n=1 Tax=uncultured Caudovirales phage TaxID=2100421 RepID=A0A6J5NA47_9CAUD|nr:hypothetical protein UFOVP660_25 [uncultured Caudovirales phage]